MPHEERKTTMEYPKHLDSQFDIYKHDIMAGLSPYPPIPFGAEEFEDMLDWIQEQHGGIGKPLFNGILHFTSQGSRIGPMQILFPLANGQVYEDDGVGIMDWEGTPKDNPGGKQTTHIPVAAMLTLLGAAKATNLVYPGFETRKKISPSFQLVGDLWQTHPRYLPHRLIYHPGPSFKETMVGMEIPWTLPTNEKCFLKANFLVPMGGFVFGKSTREYYWEFDRMGVI